MSPGIPSSGFMPTGEALTTMSTSAGLPDAADTSQEGNALRSASTSAVTRSPLGSTIRSDLTPASTKAHAIALPAPPAPNNSTRRSRMRSPFRSTPRTKPVPSNMSPVHVPSASLRNALTAPIHSAVGPRRLANRSMRALNGTVTSRPSRFPSAIRAGTISSNRAAGTSAGTSTAFTPAPANRSVKTCGERTWAMGSPRIDVQTSRAGDSDSVGHFGFASRVWCHAATRFDR